MRKDEPIIRRDLIDRCQLLGVRVDELSSRYLGVRCPNKYRFVMTGRTFWEVVPKKGVLLSVYYRELWEVLSCGIEPEAEDGLPEEKPIGRLGRMDNKSMARKLAAGECLDLSPLERTKEGDYIIPESWVSLIEGRDLCNANDETWIWSVGRRLNDGVVLASHSAKLYQNPHFECLWLR